MNTKPCNPNASECVYKVLNFFNSIEGKAIITGQHTQSRGQEELDTIFKATGELPALCGFELLSYSPNINYDDADEDCLTEISDNKDTLEQAKEWAARGGLLTFTWHWFSPLYGRDKSFFSRNTEFDATKAVIPGTAEHEAMCHDLDVMAGHLQYFNEHNIPILWRPFHESEGDWFWWGAKGMQTAKELYIFMWHYFTEKHHLNNLIWVWNNPRAEGYVGDEYCDIFTRDMYPQAHAHSDQKKAFDELKAVTSTKGIGIGETGVIPSVEELAKTNVPWLYYMTWSHEFCNTEDFTSFDELRKMYKHEYAITLSKFVSIF